MSTNPRQCPECLGLIWLCKPHDCPASPLEGMDKVEAKPVCPDCRRPYTGVGLCDMCRSFAEDRRDHAKVMAEVGAEAYNSGRKDDSGKLRFDLVPARALEDLVRIYTYGSQKYDDRNWEKGIEWSRVFAAMMRHLWAFWRGETFDAESGMPHMAHAAWGCFTLLEYMRTHDELDDRPWRDPLEGAPATEPPVARKEFDPFTHLPGL